MASTVRQGFEEFRSRLEITNLQSTTASGRQANLRANIARELTVLDSFLTGSYQRSTMIAPLKDADIDVFLVLDAGYYDAGPNACANLLDRVKRAIAKHYRETTGVSRNGQAVTVYFSDFTVDVVPAFYRQGGGYLIPNSIEKRWIGTDPKRHVALWSERNAARGGKLVPLLKMLKAWNRAHSRKLRSFHLEALALDIFRNLPITEYWTAAHDFFRSAQSMFAYTTDPAGYGGILASYLGDYAKQQEVRDRLQAAEARAQEAISLDLYYGKPDQAIAKWRIVFGDAFPAFG
ncbi:MAG: CBASS oligonucleotide cyclase [Gemmataceae bacterium]